jgi:hypothetical protein
MTWKRFLVVKYLCNMEFFISEQQLKVILMEQDRSRMSDYMKKLYNFTNTLVNKAIKIYGLNVKMLLTWGASVAGLVMPLDNYIRTGRFNLNEEQTILVLVGVAMMLFYNTRKTTSKVIEKIREENLEDVFQVLLRKATELKVSFVDFLKAINVTVGNLLEIVSYSFLIPIITDIQKVAQKTSSISETAAMIAQRLIASGVIVISAQVLTSLIKKLLKRFK